MTFENHSLNQVSVLMTEQLSAVLDGELSDVELHQLLDQIPDLDLDTHCYASMQSYVLIGEILRAAPGVHCGYGSGMAFLSELNAKLIQEPALIATEQPHAGEVGIPPLQIAEPVLARPEAANQAVFRWKMVAGLASVAAVAMVGWSSVVLLGGSSTPTGGQQIAGIAEPVAATSPQITAQGLVQMPVTVGQNATVMLRDPRLDELLAARGQIGGTANLQMPASFLRNATFNAENKAGGCPDKASVLC